jgi:ATP-dependent RNA helicase DHX57
MTPGIVSNKMQSDRQLFDVTVLIIDEVHERDLETEMLLLLVKNLIKENNKIKV